MSERCNEKPEIYSRVVGYFRPVKQWNKGKQQEFKDRKTFAVEGIGQGKRPDSVEEVPDTAQNSDPNKTDRSVVIIDDPVREDADTPTPEEIEDWYEQIGAMKT